MTAAQSATKKIIQIHVITHLKVKKKGKKIWAVRKIGTSVCYERSNRIEIVGIVSALRAAYTKGRLPGDVVSFLGDSNRLVIFTSDL